MKIQRQFICGVREGIYRGEISICVNTDEIKEHGRAAVEFAAWRKWRNSFRPPMALSAAIEVEILGELEL